MTAIYFCMFCGAKNPIESEHEVCREKIAAWRNDVARLGYRAMQLAENGFYGDAPKKDRLPPKRSAGRRRLNEAVEPKIKRADWVDWFPRACELLNDGFTHRETAEALNREGFVSRQGKLISEIYITMKLRNERKKAVSA